MTDEANPRRPDPQGQAPADKAGADAPVPAPATQHDALPTHQFGRVDAQGTVWVFDEGGERQVGSYPEELPEDPFELYVRRYLDLESAVTLFEARMPTLAPRDLDSTLAKLREQVAEPAAVGDLPALRARVEALGPLVNQRREQVAQERKQAREESLAARTAVVEAAEQIVAQPSERIQWKNSGEQLRDLLEQWKQLQRRGPRLDKSVEDALWKRFSTARTTFDRGRRQYFSALDARQAEAKRAKESLIAQAEALQGSTDWRGTSLAYRDLMDEWKKAGRASRKDDDALWARFRAARQVFFDSRRVHEQAVDEEFSANLVQKQALAAEAEALLPIRDADVTRKKLRKIQDQWEDVGQVPSREASRIEGRLRAVERALREAENKEWRRTDPETRARAEGMLAQLEDSIAELTATRDAALAAGDQRLADETNKALQVKQMWLGQISSSIE